MPSSPLVRVAYALLVLATFAAFFLTQRLKGSYPVVGRVGYPRYMSPNGDGRLDTATFRFQLPRRDSVEVSVVDDAGEVVRRLAPVRERPAGVYFETWDGRTDAGGRAPDGGYHLRVVLASQGR